MHLVKIDPIRAQPPEARLDRLHEAARRALEPLVLIHGDAEFRCQYDILAPLAEDLAQAVLRRTPRSKRLPSSSGSHSRGAMPKMAPKRRRLSRSSRP
jgi:hypothetical protein